MRPKVLNTNALLYIKRLNLNVNNKMSVIYWSKKEFPQPFFTTVKSQVFTHFDYKHVLGFTDCL